MKSATQIAGSALTALLLLISAGCASAPQSPSELKQRLTVDIPDTKGAIELAAEGLILPGVDGFAFASVLASRMQLVKQSTGAMIFTDNSVIFAPSNKGHYENQLSIKYADLASYKLTNFGPLHYRMVFKGKEDWVVSFDPFHGDKEMYSEVDSLMRKKMASAKGASL